MAAEADEKPATLDSVILELQSEQKTVRLHGEHQLDDIEKRGLTAKERRRALQAAAEAFSGR